MNGYEAVREGGVGLIDRFPRGRIRVSGSEATMFLNGLMTNDVKSLAENRWMPSVFPTVQGRLIGVVRVIRGSDPSFLIDTERASHEAVLKTISRFTLAGDFKIADLTDETELLSVQGRGAAALAETVLAKPLAGLARNGVVQHEWQGAPVTILRATHTSEDGFDVVVEAAQAASLRDAFVNAGAVILDEQTIDLLRIEAGIARFGRDIDDTNVVPETNLDDAVSYTKGCYVGQEIIVRIKHRGHVAKKLVGIRRDTNGKVDRDTIIKSTDDAEIGRVTSTAVSPKLGNIVLGYVRYEFIEPGTRVVVDDVDATVTELPFIRGGWYQE